MDCATARADRAPDAAVSALNVVPLPGWSHNSPVATSNAANSIVVPYRT
jgi:hypothetical protein